MNFTNEAGTVVAEKVTTGLRVAAERTSARDTTSKRGSMAAGGQALAGPVLLDFSSESVEAGSARPLRTARRYRSTEVALFQKNLTEAHGHATVTLGRDAQITAGAPGLANLLFPAAYTSFMQIGLAATDFGQLKTTGIARGTLDIANNAVHESRSCR